MTQDQIDNIFTYHRPTPEQADKYERIRPSAKQFAELVNELCPDSREKSLALTAIQQAVMWANAAVAINE